MFAVVAAVLRCPRRPRLPRFAARPRCGLDGCLSSGGEADCRPSQSTRGVIEMAFTADGKYAYATSFYDSRVQALKRNATTGKLDAINAPLSVDAPHGVAISPDGKNVYAADGTGVVTFTRDRPPARSPRGVTDGGLRHPRMRGALDGHRHQPRRQVRLRGDPPGQRDRRLRARRTTGALTRVAGQQGCVSERGRLVPDDPATANACVAAPAMLGIIDITVGPGGNQLYTVSDQRGLDRGVHPRRHHRPAHARRGRRAVRGARRQVVLAETTTTRWSTRTVFDCKTANPHSEYLNGISFSPNGASAYVAGRPGMAAYTRNAATGALTAVAGKDGCTHLLRDARATSATTRRTRSTRAACGCARTASARTRRSARARA